MKDLGSSSADRNWVSLSSDIHLCPCQDRLALTVTLCWKCVSLCVHCSVCVRPSSTPTPEDMDEVLQQTREMNLYCHFARGLGEARYMAAESWSSLNKTLLEVLDSYNEVNATLNLVLFEDAMAHM